MKILLIDDEPDDRHLAMYYIKKSMPDADFVEIYSKKRFYEEIEKEFDAVITDYWLKWTNGIDVFREVRKRNPFVPVIMLTGTGTEEIAVEALKMGMDDYVIKTEKHLINLGVRLKKAIESEERKKKEALLVSIVENSPEAVVSVDENGIIIYANNAVERIFGWKREEITGRNFSIFAVDKEEQKKQFEEAVAKGRARYETFRKRKDGSIVPVLMIVIPFKDSRGKLLFSSAIMIDITDIKSYQAKIDYMNRLLRIIRNINQLIARSNDIEEFLKDVYKMLKQMAEYERICIIYGDKIYGDIELNKIIKNIDEGLHKWNEVELLVLPFLNGKICISKKKFEEEERGLIEEISEDISFFIESQNLKKHIEERNRVYRRLFENADIGVYKTTKDGKIILANKYLAELLGYEDVEELKKRDLNNPKWYAGGRGREDFIEMISEKGFYKGYSTWVTKNGKNVYVKEFAVLVKEDGKEYCEGLVIDVTKLKEIVEKLERAERDWINMFESIGEPVIILTPSQDIIDANSAAAKLVGKRKEELINKKCYKIFHFKNKAPEDCPLLQLLSSNKPTSTTMDVEAVNKRFVISVFPVYDRNGKIEKIIHYMKNVEEILNIMQLAEEMETRYMYIFEKSPNALVIFDDEFNILDINSTAGKIMEMRKEEIIGKKMSEILPEKHASLFLSKINLLKKGHKVSPFLVELEGRKNKKKHIIEITVSPIQMEEKRYYLGIARDMTEKIEKETLLQRVMECSPVGILIYQNDHFVYANETALSITGYSANEISSMKFWEYVVEDAREEIKNRGKERQKGKKIKPEIYEIPFYTKNEEIRYGIFSFSNIEYNGKPAGLAIFMDITEQKKMEKIIKAEEAKFKALVENAGDGIYIINPDGFEYVNPAFERLTGYSKEEILSGSFSLWNLIHKDDIEKIKKRLKSRKAKKRIIPKYKFRLVRKNGEVRYVEVTTVDIGKDSPKVIGILRDVTADTKLEQRLREDMKEFKELSEHAPSGIFVLQDGKFVYVNKAVTKVTGYGKRELINKDFRKLVYKEDIPKVESKIKRWKSSRNKTMKMELRIKTKNDKIKWISVTVSPIEYGNKPSVLVVGSDITSKKIAEERLKELMEIYREIAFRINRNVDMEGLCKDVLEEIKNRTGIDYGNIFVYNRYLKQLIPKHFYGYSEEFKKRTMVPYDINDTRYEAVKTFIEKKTRYVEDLRKYKPLAFNRDIYEKYRVKELYSIPLISEGKVIGVLQVMSKEGNRFDRYKIRLIESIAELAATGIARIMKQYNLTQDASHHLLNPYTMAYGFLEKFRKEKGDYEDILKAMHHLERIRNVILNMKYRSSIEENRENGS